MTPHSVSFYMWPVKEISLKTKHSPHSVAGINPDMMKNSCNDRHWLFVMVELRFRFLTVVNINPMEEINKKQKIVTEQKKSLSFLMFFQEYS